MKPLPLRDSRGLWEHPQPRVPNDREVSNFSQGSQSGRHSTGPFLFLLRQARDLVQLARIRVRRARVKRRGSPETAGLSHGPAGVKHNSWTSGRGVQACLQTLSHSALIQLTDPVIRLAL